MRRTAIVAFLTAIFVVSLMAQDKKQLEQALAPEAIKTFQEKRSKLYQWDSFRFLMGNWKTQGAAAAGFETTTSLDGKVLMVSNSHRLFAAGAAKKGPAYKSLLIIYLEGLTPRATFYDNEGRVATYDVEAGANKITLIGEASGNVPRARISYEESKAGAVNIAVETAAAKTARFTSQTKVAAVRVSQ